MSKLSDSYGRVNVTVVICVSLLPVTCLFRKRTNGKFSSCRKKRSGFEKEYGIHTSCQKQGKILNAEYILANYNYSDVLILKY